MSSTKRAPALSQWGRPEGKSPASTQSVKGSVTTGTASERPVAAATTARSSGCSRVGGGGGGAAPGGVRGLEPWGDPVDRGGDEGCAPRQPLGQGGVDLFGEP